MRPPASGFGARCGGVPRGGPSVVPNGRVKSPRGNYPFRNARGIRRAREFALGARRFNRGRGIRQRDACRPPR